MASASSTPVGTSGSEPWSGPLCLVENIEGSVMKLNEETVAKLKQIAEPLVVVAIVGLYRTGKSYLMNRLANKQSGFDLGNTVQAMTKGIWIWCVAHPTRPNCRLLVMDTEGLGDVDKIADKLKIEGSQESVAEDDRELCEFFPNFVWAVRDFHLQLIISGRVVTSDEYLEDALKTKPGYNDAVNKYNAPRKCIKHYFPHRKCFGFPLPVSDSSLMTKLGGSSGSISDDQLSQAFLDVSKEFCDHVYAESEPKSVKGAVMNGLQFSGLAKYYIDTISSGGIPCVVDAFSAAAGAVNRAAHADCVAHYIAGMSKLTLPTENAEKLSEHDKLVTEQVKDRFKQQIMPVDENDKLEECLSAAIAAEYRVISERNETISAEYCRTIMEKYLESIKAKILSSAYHCMGGYSDYMKDIGAAIQAYQNTPGKGVKSNAIQQEMIAKYRETSRGIMMCDKTLSEAKIAQEEQRRAEESRMKDYEELRRRNAEAERQLNDQARRLREFERSMTEKLEEQAREYERRMLRLVKQLSKEKDRMTKTKEPKEDIDEVDETLRAMQDRARAEALERARSEASKPYPRRLFSYRLQRPD